MPTKTELANRAQSKTLQATVEPVDSEKPNGEFRLVLSCDSKDRDGDQLWADQWRLPLPDRIHMDTDHAWAKGMSVPFTAGSGVPSINSNGDLVVEGEYAETEHAQTTRKLVNGQHVRHASVSYMEHELPDGTIERELLNGTFTGVPANIDAVILSSKSLTEDKEAEVAAAATSKKSGGTTEGQYPSSDGPFADEKNRKWPLNTRKRILNAWARIHQSDATKNYNESEIATMTGIIRSAARREGIELSDDNSKDLAQLIALGCKALASNGKLHLKDVPAWLSTQTTPGNTVMGDDVGASSVYDSDDDTSDDDGSDLDGSDLLDESGTLAQAVHDAACALGACCLAGSSAEPSVATKSADEGKAESITIPLSITVAGPPGDERFTAYANGKAIGWGALKDLDLNTVTSKTGAPVGPYQGVEGMSGENASGTEPGQALGEGELFLEGTAGAAIAPQFKDQSTTTDDSSEQETASADEVTATAASKDAAVAVTPADVAARHAARLRAFEFSTKALMQSSITDKE